MKNVDLQIVQPGTHTDHHGVARRRGLATAILNGATAAPIKGPIHIDYTEPDGPTLVTITFMVNNLTIIEPGS